MFRLDSASQIQIAYVNPPNVEHRFRKLLHVSFYARVHFLSFGLSYLFEDIPVVMFLNHSIKAVQRLFKAPRQ